MMTEEEFSRCVEQVKAALQQGGDLTVEDKPINYGRRLKITSGRDTATLCLYHGKKGLKTVWGGKKTPFLETCQKLAGGSSAPETVTLLEKLPGFDGLWAGSDESGKGDYFGPLTVAAVCTDLEGARQFAAWGVCDSKALTDKKIQELAEKIRGRARGYKVLTLRPYFYNQRYAELKQKGMNLNHLLANGHIQALSKVLQACPACHFALVDQFTRQNSIKQILESRFPGLTVCQTPGGERDMAVAAASILARDAFVKVMGELEKEAGFPLCKGGGAGATEAARTLIGQKGKEKLPYFVKMHFANTKSL